MKEKEYYWFTSTMIIPCLVALVIIVFKIWGSALATYLVPNYFYKHSRLYEVITSPKVVFMGSSTAQKHIDTEIVQKSNNLLEGEVVNIGMNASTPIENYALILKNPDLFKNVEAVFYSFDPWIYSKTYYKYRRIERVLWSKEEWDIAKLEYQLDGKYLSSWKYYLKEWNKSSKGPIRLSKENQFGFKPIIGVKKESDNKKDEFKSFRLFKDLGVDTLQIKYLSKIKEHFKNSNVDFFFYISPQKRSAVEDLSVFKSFHNQIFAAIFKEMGEIEIIGNINPSNCKLSDEFFFDNSHLNHMGAIIFSRCYFRDIGSYDSFEASSLTFDSYLGLKVTR